MGIGSRKEGAEPPKYLIPTPLSIPYQSLTQNEYFTWHFVNFRILRFPTPKIYEMAFQRLPISKFSGENA